MAEQTISSASVNKILQGVHNPTASAVDFATAGGTSTYALPVYDKEGTLLGYVPVFNTPAFDTV